MTKYKYVPIPEEMIEQIKRAIIKTKQYASIPDYIRFSIRNQLNKDWERWKIHSTIVELQKDISKKSKNGKEQNKLR